MMSAPQHPSPSIIRQLFPVFDQAELVDWLVQHCVQHASAVDAQLLQVGSVIRHIPLLLSGSIKVSREDAEGREIFLYYILPGETCAMTLSACYRGGLSQVKATVQEPSTLALLSATLLTEASRRFPAWQRFVFDSFGRRFDELLQTLESVTFQHLHERLLHYLRETSEALHSPMLRISQQQIATDLNASREVISRLIRQFEQQGLLRHSRGIIEIF